MVTQYKPVTRDIGFEADAKKLKRSPYEVLIVASIIEKEVNQDKYRAKVARVLYNRLDEGMTLGLDSTVIYAEQPEDQHDHAEGPREQVEVQHLQATRACRPGPIAAPGGPPWRRPSTRSPASGSTSSRSTSTPARPSSPRTRPGFEKIRLEFVQWCTDNPGRCDS